MPILVVIIIFSIMFYLYYKIKYTRAKRPMEKSYFSAKSSIALGLFVAIFGINRIYIHQTTLTYIIAIIFIISGGLSCLAGIKSYRHYAPLANQEWQDMKD